MRVLVTGAAGRVGSVVATKLLEAGHDVLGSDLAYRPDLPFPLLVQDLLVRDGVYRLMEGRDAVVHLGNHPHMHARRPGSALFIENTTMTAHVFEAAADFRVERIIYASTIQTICGDRTGAQLDRPSCLAYLPIDGDLPPVSGSLYAASKVCGEAMLRAAAQMRPGLAAVALRLPYMRPHNRRIGHRPAWLDGQPSRHDGLIDEAAAWLWIDDLGRLIHAILGEPIKRARGYACYLPASEAPLVNASADELIAVAYPGVPRRRPIPGPGGLVDLEPLRQRYGWSPTPAEEGVGDGGW